MTLLAAHLDAGWPGRLRWAAAALIVVAAHAGIVIALTLSESEHEGNPAGIMEVDLAALAVDAPFEQPESEEPNADIAAPSPQPPSEESEPVEELEPQEAAPPEPPAEVSEAQPADVPMLEEAPLAPEPEVTLPKQVTEPEVAEKQAETLPEPKPPLPEREPEKKPVERKKAAAKPVKSREARAASASRTKFDPNPVYRARPSYPASARSSRIEGYVVVGYSISPSGGVTNVRVISSRPAGIFNAATIAAVRQWRFKPPGRQISGRKTTVRFKLR